MQMSWAKQEFETIELGDARLNQRAVLLAERLGQKPGQHSRCVRELGRNGRGVSIPAQRTGGLGGGAERPRPASQARIREHAVVLLHPGHHRTGLQRARR